MSKVLPSHVLHAAEERQFKELLARLQREPEQPGKGEPEKKTPNPTKKRKVFAGEEGQLHGEVVFRHVFGNENNMGTPEHPIRKESSTASTGTPTRTPGSTPGESGMMGGRGGHGHGQIPVSWQEKLCRNITVRAVDGTGAGTSESTTSTPRAGTCPPPGPDAEGEKAGRKPQMRRNTKRKTPGGTKKDKKK